MKRANRTTRITGDRREESLRLVGSVNTRLAQVTATAMALRSRRVHPAKLRIDAWVGQGWAHNAGQALHDLAVMLSSRRPEVMHEVRRRLKIARDAVNATADHFCAIERGADGKCPPVTREQVERPGARKRRREGLAGIIKLVEDLRSGALQSTRPEDPHFDERLRAALRGEKVDLPPPPRLPRIRPGRPSARKRKRPAGGRRPKLPPRSGASPPEPRRAEDPPAPEAPDPFAGGFGRIPNNPVLRTVLLAIYAGGRDHRTKGGWAESDAEGPIFRHRLSSRPGSVSVRFSSDSSLDAWDAVASLDTLAATVLLVISAGLGHAANEHHGMAVELGADDILRHAGIICYGERRTVLRGRVERAVEILVRVRTHGWLEHGGRRQEWTEEPLFLCERVGAAAWRLRPGGWAERWPKWYGSLSQRLLALAGKGVGTDIARRLGIYLEMLPTKVRRSGFSALIRTLLRAVGLPDKSGKRTSWLQGRTRQYFDRAISIIGELRIARARFDYRSGPPHKRRGWFGDWLESRAAFTFMYGGGKGDATSQPEAAARAPAGVTPTAQPAWAAVRCARLARGWTLERVADEIGIASVSRLSRLERGLLVTHDEALIRRARLWLRRISKT